MKKVIFALLAALIVLCLAACGSQKSESAASNAASKTEEFQPSLNKTVTGRINVAGSYSNFEALEAEFVFADNN